MPCLRLQREEKACQTVLKAALSMTVNLIS